MFALVFAYGKATGEVDSFHDHVSAVTCGDDNVANISDSICQVFNQEVVAAELEQIGLVYTSGKKDGTMVKWMDIEEATFLKRRFRSEGGNALCPLELSSFLYISYFTKQKAVGLVREVCIDNLEYALEELSMHEPELWDQYSSSIISVLWSVLRKPASYGDDRSAYQQRVLSRANCIWEDPRSMVAR